MSVTYRNAQDQSVPLKSSDDGTDKVIHHNIDAVIPGTGATNLGAAEDANLPSGKTGVAVLAQRQDTRAVSGGTDGDAVFLGMDANGNLYVVAAEKRAVVSASPMVDTAAYAAGDLIGGKLSFANAARFAGGSGRIGNVLMVDQAKQQVEALLVLFDADPTGTTFTDQAALDIADADMSKIIGVVELAFYQAFADNAIAQYTPPAGLPFVLASGTTLYGALVTRGAPTYAASSDITIRMTVIQD